MVTDLFILVWRIAQCFLVLAFVETLAVQFFIPIIFQMGIPVYNRTLEINTSKWLVQTNQTFKKEEGKFHFTTDNIVYFHSMLFRFLRVSTPFPLRAIGYIRRDNKIDIKASVPIGTSVFVLIWVSGWTALAISSSNSSGNWTNLGYALIGWASATLLLIISYVIEKGRMDKMLRELEEIITKHSTEQANH